MIEINTEKKFLNEGVNHHIDVNFNIDKGSFVSIFGPSGSGKTTILRMIAGLTKPDKGRVVAGDEVWFDSDKKIDIAIQRRDIGFVFQDYTVFPNMTVRENVEFGLKSKKHISFVDELLEIVDLMSFENRRPATLSGGQKQRLALIRALARKPKLLLLDEPFVSLDFNLRDRMNDEVLKLYKRYGMTTIFVSHEINDVFKLSKQVFVIDEGKLKITGAPEEVFLSKNLSGKYKFSGNVIDIVQDDVIYIVSVQVGSQVVKTVATKRDVLGLKLGDKVVLSSKAFNPVLVKV